MLQRKKKKHRYPNGSGNDVFVLGILLADGNGFDDGLSLGGNGAVVIGGLSLGADSVHNIHALGHIAESGILTVQESGVLMDDEELGAGAVGILGAGHGDAATGVRQGVLVAVLSELAHNIGFAAAGAVAVGVTALHHKACNDAVESQAVIETGLCQIDEVGDGNRSYIAVQLHGDGAVVFHDDISIVGADSLHGCFLCGRSGGSLGFKVDKSCDESKQNDGERSKQLILSGQTLGLVGIGQNKSSFLKVLNTILCASIIPRKKVAVKSRICAEREDFSGNPLRNNGGWDILLNWIYIISCRRNVP